MNHIVDLNKSVSFVKHLDHMKKIFHFWLQIQLKSVKLVKFALNFMSKSILFMFGLISPEGMPYKCHIFCHFMTRFDLLPDDSPLWDCASVRSVICKENTIC